MKKVLCLLLVLIIVLSLTPSLAYAHTSAADHWKELRLVLFGDEGYLVGKPENIRNKVYILQYASQVCIDQFGKDSCKASFIRLQQLGVTRLPKSIDDITLYPLSNNHREYTHLGWDYDYSMYCDERNKNWTDTWEKRQILFLSAVEKVFNFNGLPDLYDGVIGGYTEECKAFTKLLYYVHLLGDHLEYSASSYEKGKDQVIPLGATRGDSLIGEILEVLPVLFPNQDYSQLERDLMKINTDVCSILNKPDELKTDFSPYHKCAEEVLNTLVEHIPGLLQKEDYFTKAFM